MNCKEVQAQILSYIHGEVTPSEKRLIATHLSGCTRCAAQLENTENLETQLRQHIQQRALRVAAPASGWQALQVRLEAERAAAPGRTTAGLHKLFSGLTSSGWRLTAAAFLVLLALFALTPAVRAQVQAQIQQIAGDWFHFSTPDGQSQAEFGGFSAFTPYHASYLPEGFQLSGMGGSTAPGVETITLGYNRDEKFVELAQSKGPDVSSLPKGESLALNGSTAVFIEGYASSAGELQQKMPYISVVVEYDYSRTNLLAWDVGAIRMEMVSNLPKDEMVRITESLAPMQSGQLPSAPPTRGARLGALELLVILLFGWTGIAVGLALAAVGLLKRSLAFGVAGLLLGLPFSFYLLATPGGWLFGLILPLLLGVSAYACSKPERLKPGWASLILAGALALGIYIFSR